MQLDLLRHGITVSNLEGRFPGLRDERLMTEQMRRIERIEIDAGRYDMVCCSPLLRCIQTAACLRIPAWKVEPRIVERDLGVFGGMTAAECHTLHPDDFAAFRRFDAHYAIPGGESRAQHAARVFDWLEDIGRFERVLAVTHGGTIDFVYRLGTHRPLHGGDEVFAGENVALSRFEIVWPDVRLVTFSEPLPAVV